MTPEPLYGTISRSLATWLGAAPERWTSITLSDGTVLHIKSSDPSEEPMHPGTNAVGQINFGEAAERGEE